MVVGELIPKNLVLARPSARPSCSRAPLRVFSVMFGPLIKVANGTANWLVRRLGVEPQEELASVRSLEELELVFRSSSEEGDARSQSLAPAHPVASGSARRPRRTRSCPGLAVEALAGDDTVADLVARAVDTGFSRFPVVRCRSRRRRRRRPRQGRVPPRAARTGPAHRSREIMDEPLAVPETRELESLFGELRRVGDPHGHRGRRVRRHGRHRHRSRTCWRRSSARSTTSTTPPSSRSGRAAAGTWILAGHPPPRRGRGGVRLRAARGRVRDASPASCSTGSATSPRGRAVDHDGWTLEVREMDRLPHRRPSGVHRGARRQRRQRRRRRRRREPSAALVVPRVRRCSPPTASSSPSSSR